MQNYFNYFTEIEQRFQQRRGSLLMLSTLDWALIETWREAGVPLEAVLRGIDSAFDKYDARALRTPRRLKKINGLAWCAQSVMEATQEMIEASTGAISQTTSGAAESGFETERVQRFLLENAATIEIAQLTPPADATAAEVSARIRALAAGLQIERPDSLEELDRSLTVLEEKFFAALMTSTPASELEELRAQAAQQLAPYRGRMQAIQIKQVTAQFLQKRLFEARKLPRLSLFYMSVS
jgi:hypothetical protein